MGLDLTQAPAWPVVSNRAMHPDSRIPSHVPLTFALAFAAIVAITGCRPSAYDQCNEIELGSSTGSLPVEENAGNPGHGHALRGPVGDLTCCYFGIPDSGISNCGVDCSAPENRATPLKLGGGFAGECVGGLEDGTSHCTAWVRDGKVVATQYFCGRLMARAAFDAAVAPARRHVIAPQLQRAGPRRRVGSRGAPFARTPKS